MLSELYIKRLQTLAGLNESSKTHKNEYGALMLEINYKEWDEILSTIDKEDIYDESGFGLEKKPHITVLFGFNNDSDYDEIKKTIKENHKNGNVKVIIKNITHFETSDYDVVKFDVESEDLFKLNKLMTDNFKFTTDYPDYHPHMTIAYVKKGTGKKYNTNKKEKTINGNELVYSPSHKGGNKKYFTL